MLAAGALTIVQPLAALAQIKGQARTGGTPPWNKGILPISPESYYNAIECGKQGGADPPCVFWDTGLCKNDDFVLAMYTPYKQVAYEVWVAVSKKQPAPQPSYPAAQRTRVTIGVTQAKGSKNALTDLVVKRGGRSLPRSIDRSAAAAAGSRSTFRRSPSTRRTRAASCSIWWARRRPSPARSTRRRCGSSADGRFRCTGTRRSDDAWRMERLE